jgi:hypothetical protein
MSSVWALSIRLARNERNYASRADGVRRLEVV